MRNVQNSVFAVLLLTAGLWAQDPSFEVASVKPAPPGGRGMSINRTEGGRLTTQNVPLRFLITFAYGVRDFQLSGGPGWMSQDRWDISAKPEGGIPPGPDGNLKIRAMVRSLLAERFGLVIHEETKEMPVYAMVVAKNGPKLTASPEGARGPSIRMERGQLSVTKCPLNLFAETLSNQVSRVVLDETGVKGDFDFKLEFAPEQNGPPKQLEGQEKPVAEQEGPSIFTALQEQLGLKLESKKGPVKILVIDKAERPTEN